jgi:hypothetical protein
MNIITANDINKFTVSQEIASSSLTSEGVGDTLAATARYLLPSKKRILGTNSQFS